tara:strand:+ start:120 stop:764 length:645 start_codon:yes stop_codon:yes gene_type:complete
MIERSLKDAIQQFRKNIDDSDYANLGAKGKYLTVPYRIKFVRDYFGERMSIQTESTELANGSHKFKANIYIDDKLVSVGESKQMKNADKEFEKQQTVSIGRGLSILGFFGDELATAEEMEQFLKPQKKEITKPIIKPTAKPKANTKQLADEWIEVLKKTATHSVSVGKFEQNLNPLRQEYLSDLKQINSDLIQQQRIDQEYISLQKQITTNRTK